MCITLARPIFRALIFGCRFLLEVVRTSCPNDTFAVALRGRQQFASVVVGYLQVASDDGWLKSAVENAFYRVPQAEPRTVKFEFRKTSARFFLISDSWFLAMLYIRHARPGALTTSLPQVRCAPIISLLRCRMRSYQCGRKRRPPRKTRIMSYSRYYFCSVLISRLLPLCLFGGVGYSWI